MYTMVDFPSRFKYCIHIKQDLNCYNVDVTTSVIMNTISNDTVNFD